MKKIRGANRGKSFTISQFCNDWITVRESNEVLSPMNVQLETEEEALLFITSKDPGIFWALFELDTDRMRFKKVARQK